MKEGIGVLLLFFNKVETTGLVLERILEAKGMLTDENAELERQYEIFKRIRMQRAEER